MATLVYAPAIRVHVETENGILDISDDISNWEIIRRSNAPSTFNFVLQNTQRKYDQAFRPSDRITVELKRLVWVRVFTGSLNTVPIFSAWPRALPLSATCSLKKLQFWPWDPTTTESSNMIQSVLASLNQNTVAGDAGLSNLIATSLVDVTNWDPKAVHIGAVPNAWFKWAQSTELAIDAASSMAAVLGPSSIGGNSSTANIKLKGSSWGGAYFAPDQLANAVTIYAATIQSGPKTIALQDRAATLALMVAIDESSLENLNSEVDHTSLGIFQQQEWWGTSAQRLDIRWATLAFLKGTPATGAGGTTAGKHIHGLYDVPNWITGTNFGLICQAVQQSAYSSGSNYAAWQPAAEAIVAACRKQVTGQVSSTPGSITSPLDPTGPSESGVAGYQGTGDQVAKVAFDLITVLNSPPHIQYSKTLASDPRSDNPTYLDCSQLVRWVLYHVTGASRWYSDTWRTTQQQWPQMPIKNIPLDIASNIRGCVLYGVGTSNGSFGTSPDHTGIAIGDGQTHVAAHTDGVPIAQQVNISDLPGGLYSGTLAPGIDYTSAGTTDAAVAYLSKVLKKKCSKSKLPLSSVRVPDTSGSQTNPGASDPFGQLISVITSAPAVIGDIFGGTRQLINNQPFLQWFGNLVNSSMRAYCSAPNGDFMAWFPDYFNVWNTAAIMDIKPIELQDFTVEWSDQQIVTHEYVLGSLVPTFSPSDAGIVEGGSSDYQGLYAMLSTEGVAVMIPQIFQTIYGKQASGKFINSYLARFGGRPNVESMPNISHGPQEFYMALWLFMKHWSEQFNATIPMTFMPELWPGMIIRLQEYGFQAYVTEVHHRGSYGSNGQFTTEAKIIAPAPIDENLRSSLFGMLDITG